MKTILGLWALVLLGSGAWAGEVGSVLSSPMVDHAIYREGAIRRLSGQFGDWVVTCDEIASLRQRYCSLRALEQRTGRRQPASVEVSTGDNGRPAALLHLPLRVSVEFGVMISTAVGEMAGSRPSRAAQPALGRKLNIVACTDRECLAVWSLSDHEIRALTSGGGLTITVCSPGDDALEFATDLKRESCALTSTGLLSGAGFKDAVQASLR